MGQENNSKEEGANKRATVTKHQLNEFLASFEMDQLEAELNQFNPFKVLKLNKHEIRHSNMLAWLMDPQGSHNLGDKFLKKILYAIILQNSDKVPFSVFDVKNSSFHDLIIKREWKNLDLFLYSKANDSEKNDWVMVIENKTYSSEHSEQLSRYREIVREKYPDVFSQNRMIFIYLTLLGDKPENNAEYGVLSYTTLYQVMQESVQLYESQINGKTLDFINYYITILKEMAMMEIGELGVAGLCKSIYKQHWEAIEAIIKHGRTTQFASAAAEFLHGIASKQNRQFEQLALTGNVLYFIPSEFKNVVKGLNTTKNLSFYYPVQYFFILRDVNNLKLRLEVGLFDDPMERVKFMNFLLTHSGSAFRKIPENAKQEGVQETYLKSEIKKVEDPDDKDEIRDTMFNMYEGFAGAEKKLIELVNEYLVTEKKEKLGY